MTWITNQQLKNDKSRLNNLTSELVELKLRLNYLTQELKVSQEKLNIVLSQPPEEVIRKDPHGLIMADLAKIELFMDSKPHKVDDSMAKIQRKEGQKELLEMIKSKLIAPKTSRLT